MIEKDKRKEKRQGSFRLGSVTLPCAVSTKVPR